MAATNFLVTSLAFESYKDLFEVSTDADYVYIQTQKQDAENMSLRISIEDWFDIITYIEKQLK